MAPARTEKKSTRFAPFPFGERTNQQASSAPVTSRLVACVTSRHVASRDPASATSTKKHAVDSTTSNDNDASTETQIPVVDPVTLHLKREAVVVGSIDDHLKSLGPSWCAESSIHQKNKIDADGFASKNPERHMLARRRAFLEKFSDPAAQQPYALRRAIQRANDKVKQLAEEAAAIDNPRAAKENQRGIDGRGTREKRSAQLRLPEDPKLYEEWYLVTGRNVGKPGAYPSWRRAQDTAEPTATPQTYTAWEALESACLHYMPAPLAPALALVSLFAIGLTIRPSPADDASVFFTLADASYSSLFPAAAPACDALIDTPRYPREDGARALYLQLQGQGFSAALSCSPSLTDGVCWIEGFVIGAPSREAARRRAWIGEEHAARQYWLETSVESDDDSWWSDNSGVEGEAQRDFLLGQLDSYAAARAAGSLTRFWNQLAEAWFERWPVEIELGIVALNTEDQALLDQKARETMRRVKHFIYNYARRQGIA
ncbi:hypothetical protein DFH06DRAFT_1334880 [Mycena polygramma]|nr:hypothetical protein DFH06DRAFT_1334880 [Mycena polygramma]